MDEAVDKIIRQMKITVPVVHIKDSNYLVGHMKVNLIMKRDSILVQKGGGSEKFENFISNNHKSMQRNLVIFMIQTSESLEYVIDSIINGKKFKSIEQRSQQTKSLK